MTEGTTAKKSALERFLNLFTEVHGGEGPLTLLMAFNVFLLLTSYYLIKPVRDALILAEGGAEARSYLAAAMAAILFFLVGGYAKLVSRCERTRLITVVTGRSEFLDVGLGAALINFVATCAFAAFLERKRL